MDIDDNPGRRDDEPLTAPRHAEVGAEAWQSAVHAQRSAIPDHTDFYALAAEIVPALHSLQELANVLRRQVAGYAAGRQIYDDTGVVDPAVRLAEAAEALALMRDALAAAQTQANAFWSAIGHIGIRDVPR
jgi:hypothetical protein